MRYSLTVFLIATMLAGCSGGPNIESTTQKASAGGTSAALNATPTSPEMAQAITKATTSVSKPMVITVRPPLIPIEPIEGTPALPVPTPGPIQGWQTFTSSALGVAVDYPTDWSVTENDEGAKFTSPQGVVILLQVDKNKSDSLSTGQDCTTLINSYGQTGELCFDAASSGYNAAFKATADASRAWMTLSVVSPEKPTVFYQMFDSFRFVP